MFNIGSQELLVILLVVLLLFGAKRIPEVSRSLGKGLSDFRDALSGVERELKGESTHRAPTPFPPPRIVPPPEGQAPVARSSAANPSAMPDSGLAGPPAASPGGEGGAAPVPGAPRPLQAEASKTGGIEWVGSPLPPPEKPRKSDDTGSENMDPGPGLAG